MQPAHDKIGVVDTQWVVHQSVPSLGNQVNKALKDLLYINVLNHAFYRAHDGL